MDDESLTFLSFRWIEEFLFGFFYILRTDPSDEKKDFLTKLRSYSLVIIGFLIQTFQILPYASSKTNLWSCDDDAFCILSAILGPVRFISENSDVGSTYLSAVLCLIVTLFTIFAICVAIINQTRNFELTWEKVVFQWYIQLIVNTYIVEVAIFGFIQFSCSSECSSTNRILTFLFSWITLMLLIPFAILTSMFYEKFEMGRSLPGTMAHGRLEVLSLFYKIMICVFFSVRYSNVDSKGIFITFYSISAFTGLTLLIAQVMRAPFISKIENQMRACYLGICTIASFLGLIETATEQEISTAVFWSMVFLGGSAAWSISTVFLDKFTELMRLEISNMMVTYTENHFPCLENLIAAKFTGDQTLVIQNNFMNEALIQEIEGYMFSDNFIKIRNCIIFETDCELLVRQLTAKWNKFAVRQREVIQVTIYLLFYSLLRFSNRRNSFIYILFGNLIHTLFNDINMASSFLRIGLNISSSYDMRFYAFSLQKHLDTSEVQNSIGASHSSRRTTKVSDLALYRRAMQTAKTNHKLALQLLSKSFKLLVRNCKNCESNRSTSVLLFTEEAQLVLNDFNADIDSFSTENSPIGLSERQVSLVNEYKILDNNQAFDTNLNSNTTTTKKMFSPAEFFTISKSKSIPTSINYEALQAYGAVVVPAESFSPEYVKRLQDAISCLAIAEANYSTLISRFPSNPEAVRNYRLFHRHFFRDDSTTETNLKSFNSLGNDGESSSQPLSMSSASSIDKENMKRSNVIHAFQSTMKSFFFVRMGTLIGFIIVTAMMITSALTIRSQLDKISDRINQLEHAELLYREFPATCRLMLTTYVQYRDRDNSYITPTASIISPISLASASSGPSPSSDGFSICETALNDIMTEVPSMHVLRGCIYALSDGSGVRVLVDPDTMTVSSSYEDIQTNFPNYQSSSGSDTDSDDLNNWWWKTNYRFTEGLLNAGEVYLPGSFTVPFLLTTIKRNTIVAPLVSTNNAFSGIIAIEIDTTNENLNPSEAMTQLVSLNKELTSSVETLIQLSSSDRNQQAISIFNDPNLTLLDYFPDNTTSKRNVGLQEGVGLFSFGITTTITALKYGRLEALESDTGFKQSTNACFSDVTVQMLNLVTSQVNFIIHFIDRAILIVSIVVSFAILSTIISAVLTIRILRLKLSFFDHSDQIPLAVRILLCLDQQSKMIMFEKFHKLQASLEKTQEKDALINLEPSVTSAIKETLENKQQISNSGIGAQGNNNFIINKDSDNNKSADYDSAVEETHLKIVDEVENKDGIVGVDEKEFYNIVPQVDSLPEKPFIVNNSDSNNNIVTKKISDSFSFDVVNENGFVANNLEGNLVTDLITENDFHVNECESKRKYPGLHLNQLSKHPNSIMNLHLKNLANFEAQYKHDPKLSSLTIAQRIKRTLRGSISRVVLFFWILVGLVSLASFILLINRVLSFKDTQQELKDVCQIEGYAAITATLLFDAVENDFASWRMVEQASLRVYLDAVLSSFQNSFSALALRHIGYKSFVDHYALREELVFGDNTCITDDLSRLGQSPSNCDSITYSNRQMMTGGLYKAVKFWIERTSWLIEGFRDQTSSLSITSNFPNDLWWLLNSNGDVSMGIHSLLKTVMMESSDKTEQYKTEEMIFLGFILGVTATLLLSVEFILYFHRRKLTEAELVMRIIPSKICNQQRIFERFFLASDISAELFNSDIDDKHEK